MQDIRDALAEQLEGGGQWVDIPGVLFSQLR